MVTPGPGALAEFATSPEWRRALAAVPRERFVPDEAWANPIGGAPGYWIDRAHDPGVWAAAVYSDTVITTQVDDGKTVLTAEACRVSAPTSSTTAPGLVAEFLELLDPYPGDRVLEIGTGTGWTAALLSERLGAQNVTSVEVDEQVSKQSAADLERAGYAPTLITGDGLLGHPGNAPYDRVHVTCGVREVPYAWVEQTRPGGLIVCAWMLDGGSGYRVPLAVTGEAAVGRFGNETGYMLLRGQRPVPYAIEGGEREATARVDPRRITRAGSGCRVALAGLLPGVSISGSDHPDGTHRLGLGEPATASHALAVHHPGGEVEVTQRGPRELWAELESAYLAWVGWGSPGTERFGLTVRAEGQYVWLDCPANELKG